MRRRDGAPLWIDETRGKALLLRRADLRTSTGPGNYDEAWLQRMLHDFPAIVPVEQVESGFGRLIPLCRELPLTIGGGRTGALDNLFVTSEGRLLLAEAKLWRNPEARRTVVAQAMEYAAAVFRLTYQELETAVLRARASAGETQSSLYEIATGSAEGIDEAEFVDAISRNLSRGRAVVAVVGDGIREDIVPLAELLQTHAGHRFTFALIELAVYEAPESSIRIIAPSVLAQTALIERGVVQIEDGNAGKQRIVVRDPPATRSTGPRERSFGIGEDEFYELLEQNEPGVSERLKSFLAKAETRGVFADHQSGLNLKHVAPTGNDLNVGTITKNGYVDTGPATWWDRTEIGRRYNEALAAGIGGRIVQMKGGRQSAVRTQAGKMPRLPDFLPEHEDVWLSAIDRYLKDAFDEAT